MIARGHSLDTARLESEEEFTFDKVVRTLPRRRFSGFATWRGLQVFAKLFIGRRAKIHWKREERGLRALQDASIFAPRILHSGRVEGGYVLISERIVEGKTADDSWNDAADDDARIELVRRLAATLAAHHNAGLRQTDLHLHNFLVADEIIYTLDGAGIVAKKPERQNALDNLALLLAQVHRRFDIHSASIYSGYARQRGWSVERGEVESLAARVEKARSRRLREYLLKTFRECSAFKCEKTFYRFTVYDRSCDSTELRRLLADPDSAFCGALLKIGNTSTVAKISPDSREFVIKRYNIKGAWHGVKRALRRTRAARSWANAHRLRFYEIATAKPIALIEKRHGPLRSTSYLITEFVPGPNVLEFLAAAPAGHAEEVVQKTAALLFALRSLGLSHGDMKATNIVIREGEPVLLDLDSMRTHRSAAALRRAIIRDARRLLANWEPGSGTHRTLSLELGELLR